MLWDIFSGKTRKLLGIPKLFGVENKESDGLAKFIGCGSCSMLLFLLILIILAVLAGIMSTGGTPTT